LGARSAQWKAFQKEQQRSTVKTSLRDLPLGVAGLLKTIEMKRGKVVTIDQTKLPHRYVKIRLEDCDEVCQAIREMRIRGAPLIGSAAGYGLALTAHRSKSKAVTAMIKELEHSAGMLMKTRPTAVNLRWAVQKIMGRVRLFNHVEDLRAFVLNEADRIRDEDIRSNIVIGKTGAALLKDGDTVLTHCNAGALATSGYGTALGVIRAAVEEGKRIKVIATETRPLLQGARLTAYELASERIPVKLITDSMVGHVIQQKLVDKVIVGADRILRTGHVANKIGTYTISLAAKAHGVPFYVAAPLSTFDFTGSLESIVIEHRKEEEVLCLAGKRIAPRSVGALNPAFDITPPENVTAIITEEGVLFPPYEVTLSKLAEPTSSPGRMDTG